MKDVQCVELNEKSIFRFLFFELWLIVFAINENVPTTKIGLLTQHVEELLLLHIVTLPEHDVVPERPVDVQVNLPHVRGPLAARAFHLLGKYVRSYFKAFSKILYKLSVAYIMA